MLKLSDVKDWRECINKVVQGDCLEGMKMISDKSIDLIVTDPPYGINFQSNHRKQKHNKILNDDIFSLEALHEMFRIAKRAVYVFCRWDNIYLLPKPKSILVWVKNNWSMGDLEHEHGRQWEAICFYPQEEHKFKKRIPDIIQNKKTGNNLHPTEKPVDLIQILLAANEGDLVCDPFMGSWTTARACKDLGRNFIGFELEEKYCKVGEERLRQENLF